MSTDERNAVTPPERARLGRSLGQSAGVASRFGRVGKSVGTHERLAGHAGPSLVAAPETGALR
jgi:hypothetical protein